MWSIYFADVLGSMSGVNKNELNILKVYSYNTKLISDYQPNDNYNIGDILLGVDFVICIIYENIRLLPTCYEWGTYLMLLTELLELDENEKLLIYTNNNNAILKHNSLDTNNKFIQTLLEPLRNRYSRLEIC